jgi:hypothetical protein
VDAVTQRFHIPFAGDVPPTTAARALGMTLEAFAAALPLLTGRGFPGADPTTGNYDLDAIDAWRRARYPHLFGERVDAAPSALDASRVDVAARVASLPRRTRSG